MQKKKAAFAAAVGAVIAGMSGSALAVDNNWTGATSNDWNVASNWSLGRVPVNPNPDPIPPPDNFDDAIVNTLNNFPVITANLAATPRDIIVGNGGASARVDHRAGVAATSGGNWFYVARFDGSNATYNLADTSTPVVGNLTGFAMGSGQINVGQRTYVGGTDFGTHVGTQGTLNVNTSGGIAMGNDLGIGVDGATGVMNLDAGTITTAGWNFIGKADQIAGGTGTLNIAGGTITNGGGRTYIGKNNANGTMTMTGGTYNNPGDRFIVGANNLTNLTTPTLNMNGGTLNPALLTIGGHQDESGKGQLNVTNANAAINASELWVGQNTGSTGGMTMSAGKVTTSGWFVVGRAGGTGVLTMSGGTIEKAGGSDSHFILGSLGGTGTTNQSGGAVRVLAGDMRLGENAGAVSTYSLSAGTVEVAGAIRNGWVGGAGLSSIGVSGGAVTAGSIVNADGGPGTITQTGGTVAVTGDLNVEQNAAQVGQYLLSGGVLSVNGAINKGGGDFTFGGTGRMTRSDGGIVTFNGDLTVGGEDAGFNLGNTRQFDVNGLLNVASGITFDVSGVALPAQAPGGQGGSIHLGDVNSIVGTFSELTTNLPGLVNTPGATQISETAGEGGLFDPSTQSVYWVQESGGLVDLRFSIAPIPEPGALTFIAVGGITLLRRRRK